MDVQRVGRQRRAGEIDEVIVVREQNHLRRIGE